MVPAGSRKIPRVPRYSGYRYASSDFEYRTLTVYGPIFQTVSRQISCDIAVLQPRSCRNMGGLG